MTYHTGPKIVTDGLVLCLDAADRNSYPGTGTSWYDLSGNGNNGIINNATFSYSNGGIFYFDGSDDYVNCGNGPSLTMTDEITIDYIVKPLWNTGYTPLIDKRNGLTGTEHYSTWIGNDKQLDYIARPNSDKRPLVNGSSIFSANNWYMIQVAVFANGDITCNINNQRFSTTGGDIGPTNSNSLLIGGFTNTSGANASLGDGYIGYVRIYNKALSADEISQNYNATKGRFGL